MHKKIQISRPKRKGLPNLGEQLVLPGLTEDEVKDSSDVAYRLPSPIKQRQRPPSNRLWGRHGYDYYNRKPVQSATNVENMRSSPVSARVSSISVNFPKFSHAMVIPVDPSQQRLYAGVVHDSAFLRNTRLIYKRPPVSSTPAPTPMSEYHRINTSAMSFKTSLSADAIHWALSPYKKVHFDKKGGVLAQGPYSRSMTVTCSAPNNWMRMKLGHKKTMEIR